MERPNEMSQPLKKYEESPHRQSRPDGIHRGMERRLADLFYAPGPDGVLYPIYQHNHNEKEKEQVGKHVKNGLSSGRELQIKNVHPHVSAIQKNIIAVSRNAWGFTARWLVINP
jgi:hypothetical protein